MARWLVRATLDGTLVHVRLVQGESFVKPFPFWETAHYVYSLEGAHQDESHWWASPLRHLRFHKLTRYLSTVNIAGVCAQRYPIYSIFAPTRVWHHDFLNSRSAPTIVPGEHLDRLCSRHDQNNTKTWVLLQLFPKFQGQASDFFTNFTAFHSQPLS